MTLRNKFIITAILLLLSLVAGSYLSSFILLQWLGLDKTPLVLTTWFKYFNTLHLPQVAAYSLQIKTSGIAGFGLPLLAYLFSLVPIWRTASPSLHGEARFSGMSDLVKAGFFKQSDTSLVVGKYNGKLLHYSGQQFALLAAPTRSGKGVGIVIPNLLSYKSSVVVLDIKQENFNLTSGYRKEVLGQEVYLFNPFAEDGRTHRWNPFTYVSSDPDQRVSDLMSIAAMLYPDGDSRDKFWVAQARNAFLAFSLYCFDSSVYKNTKYAKRLNWQATVKEPPCTLGKIYRLSSGNGTELKEYFTSLSQKPFLSPAAKTAFSGLISQEKETFGSIMGTFKEPLNPWINPIIDAATSADDFLLTDVRKKKMTVYIGILPNKLAESRIIVNLFFSQLINQNTKELPQDNPDLQHQCLLLMDEFTSIGRVEIIAHSVSYMAGYNIRLFPIIQSVAQLDAVYGKEYARTIITNHALQIIYTPREQQDANEYSEMLGYTTVKRKNVSRGRERSVSESEERRALMLPQELKGMSQDSEIIIYEGMAHPAKVNKIRYYQDGMFTKRLKGAVKVASLKGG
ncbi:type IV secretory system conjugative DNA transfer family protein [Neisseria sp. P0001.S005]|jgi:virD4 protein|uniref:type IV secretory system conjugative DNA transfer family protein n=1 Tax=Neisseria sp. P0001.S005 TaxID=3436649 RepID=UPI0028D095EB|nr:type IV secretory system conjugative DNA transfer family protein [uncultured Neisseria sp.]